MEMERDEFLSEEDLDLRNLSEEELIAHWNLWLEQAQVTNDLDKHTYSHGVLETMPASALSAFDKFPAR
jgi:hypothetical protein